MAAVVVNNEPGAVLHTMAYPKRYPQRRRAAAGAPLPGEG